jgi:hypothetical protein
MHNIRQNLFFAFISNVVGAPIAAGLLYPFFGLLLSPMIASAAMTFSSVFGHCQCAQAQESNVVSTVGILSRHTGPIKWAPSGSAAQPRYT